MTPAERDLIAALFERLRAATPPQKDAEALDFIQRQMATQPDAAYMLVQTVLVQEHALSAAKARIDALERGANARPQSASPSFLPHLGADPARSSGRGPDEPPPGPWSRPSPVTRPTLAGWGGAAAPAGGYGTGQPYAAPIGAAQLGGGGGFLRSAMATAVGVAGGALLFEGISNLFSHHATPFADAAGWTGTPTEVIENTEIINNYGLDTRDATYDGHQGGAQDVGDTGYQDASYDAGDAGDAGASGGDFEGDSFDGGDGGDYA